MIDTRVAPRYAKSLLDLGIEQNNLESLFEDMKTLRSALDNRDLYLLTKSPIIMPDKKISIFQSIFGEQFNKVSMAFIRIITKKGREKLLLDIAETFINQYKSYNKITPVKLTTASQINDEALQSIKDALKSSVVTDEKVELETSVDPELIGGFVIEIEDKLYDASVAHKLEEIRKKFLDSKYIKSF